MENPLAGRIEDYHLPDATSANIHFSVRSPMMTRVMLRVLAFLRLEKGFGLRM